MIRRNNRPDSFVLTYFLMVLGLFSCTENNSHSGGPEGRPNILFIAVDDLRPQLGVYGEDFMVTPHMDRLAREGRLFTNHYVIVPTCGPSRYALLTGQYPLNTAELRNDIFEKTTALQTRPTNPDSMVDAFRRNGYYTVGMGKIHPQSD